MKKSSLLHILIGLAAFALIGFVPAGSLFTPEARIASALLVLMVYWWITRPVHIAVTALLPIIVTSLFNIDNVDVVLANYFSPIAVLLIGANIIIACWVKSGLDRRIALKSLTIIGTRVKRQLVVWFILATVTSMFLPNAVVAATLCPIAAAMLHYTESTSVSDPDPDIDNLIYLSIVWGAGIGGFGTPLGGAMNLVAIDYIESFTGQELMYITWTLKMLPYLIVLSAVTCVYLITIKTKTTQLAGSRAFFIDRYQALGKMKRSERAALILFVGAVVLAFTRPLYQDILPAFKPYYAFLLAGAVAFFVKGEDDSRLIKWDEAVRQINWGMILLFSGGLALGKMLISTGAAQVLANQVASANVTSASVFILLFILLGMFLSNASSNTAATSVLIPIVITVSGTLMFPTLPFIYIAAAACNCAFILPTSIRAIPVGYGLDINYMFKKGLMAVAATFAALFVSALVRLLFI